MYEEGLIFLMSYNFKRKYHPFCILLMHENLPVVKIDLLKVYRQNETGFVVAMVPCWAIIFEVVDLENYNLNFDFYDL